MGQLGVLLGTALFSCAEKRGTRPSTGEPDPLERKISIRCQRAGLPQVLDDLKERAGLRSAYVLFADRGFTFTFEAEGASVREVLRRLAEAGGLAFDCEDDIVVFWRESDEELRRELRRKPVTFEFVDTPLEEALEFLQAISGVEICLDSRLKKDTLVTLKVDRMGFRSALLWLLRICDLEYAIHAGTIYVSKAELFHSLPTPTRAKISRAGAAPELDRVADEEELELLKKALTDEDRDVRAEAARALGRTGDERTVALLEEALTDTDRWVRRCALEGLGTIGGERALALLEKELLSPARSTPEGTVEALGLSVSARAVALLLRALEMEVQEDDPVRQWMLRVLRERKVSLDFEEIPLSEAISSFQTMTKENMLVDWEGSDAANRPITLRVQEVSEEEALERLLENSGLVWGLGESFIIIATPERLAEWGDQYNEVRERAFEALRRFRGNIVRDALIARAASEPYERLRKKIVEFLKISFAGDPVVR